MEKFFDVYVNLSPIIFIILCILKKHVKNILFLTIYIIIVILCLNLFLVPFIFGFGNHIIAITSLLFLLVYSIIYVFKIYKISLFSKEQKNLSAVILICIIFFDCIICINFRLFNPDFLDFNIIEEIADIKNFILEVVENEWIKGICIAATGGIVAGIFLNKFFKN